MSKFDYQKVRAIAITKPLIEGINDAQELIAFMARVSNPANQMNHETAGGLLRYCQRNAHWSIFEMVNIQFEIETTRDIARQLLRHQSLKFQEFSQRYADPVQELEFVTREARFEDEMNRQNSFDPDTPDQHALNQVWKIKQQRILAIIKEEYEWAAKNKIAKEQRRCILPEGNTMSRLYVNANLRSVIHYTQLRMGNGTQKEHRDLASKMFFAAVPHFPFLQETAK